MDQREFGIGMVIRNFRGHVLAAKLQWYLGDINAKRLKTITTTEGLF